MSRSSLLTAVLVVAFAAEAQADLWKRASEPVDPTMDVYTALMQKGDEAAQSANTRSISSSSALKLVDTSLEAYRAASKIKPRSAEPWFRIASVLDSFFFDGCDKNPIDPTPTPVTCDNKLVDRTVKARELLEAWDRFESLGPLDPRVNDMLYRRAIQRTKLLGTAKTTEPLLRAVIVDYQALLDRQDGLARASVEGITGNLAETHLMLGDTEKAIELYRLAIRAGGGTSTIYGLAVAIDRDGRGALALEVIRSQGLEGKEQFERAFDRKEIFFVPAGEVEYYFALTAEAFGDVGEAVNHWKAFIQSGAHPKYQPRAKEHLERLALRRNLRIDVPIVPDLGRNPIVRPRRSPTP